MVCVTKMWQMLCRIFIRLFHKVTIHHSEILIALYGDQRLAYPQHLFLSWYHPVTRAITCEALPVTDYLCGRGFWLLFKWLSVSRVAISWKHKPAAKWLHQGLGHQSAILERHLLLLRSDLHFFSMHSLNYGI